MQYEDTTDQPDGVRPTVSEDFKVPLSPSAVRLSDYDPRSKGGFRDKDASECALEEDVKRLCELHDVFAAQSERALLIVLQGMDGAGKDGIIKHVMSGMNPQGVHVYGFRKPSEEERLHPFMWREAKVLPARGRIAIFNRSYYEEVLILRVMPQLLAGEGANPKDPTEWERRYEDINAFERHLTNSGTIVLKFCLHLSKEEQRKRLLDRLENPKKMWKASDADLEGHSQWDAYVDAYEAMLGHTSTAWAPWYLVPADRKWVTRTVVGCIIVEALERLHLRYPEPAPERVELFGRLAAQLREEDR